MIKADVMVGDGGMAFRARRRSRDLGVVSPLGQIRYEDLDHKVNGGQYREKGMEVGRKEYGSFREPTARVIEVARRGRNPHQ